MGCARGSKTKGRLMPVKSVYLPNPVIESDLILVQDEEHRHLSVARVQPGERLEVFDGMGTVWDTVTVRSDRHETVVRVESRRLIERDPCELILGLSLIQASAFELAIEKAVETGVHRIIPILASRSNVRDARRKDRWQRIIIEASKQSKRYRIPALDDAVSFEEVLRLPATSRILFAERDDGKLQSALTGSPVLYLIGPEGGWTDSELNSARSHDFSLVGLGPTILRAETAAIIATALVSYELRKKNPLLS